MKTSVKTIFITALTAIVLSTTAFASVATDKDLLNSCLSTTIDFNKVVITGNVNVELIQSDRQKVVIYETYNKATTTIKQKGEKLFINSNEEQPINIIVYVKDLHRIDASNTVKVKTSKFLSNVLQIFLKDNATASVSAEVGSLYTMIKDNSELKLKGTTEDHVSVKSKVSRLNTNSFAARRTTSSNLAEGTLVQNNVMSLSKDTVIAERIVR